MKHRLNRAESLVFLDDDRGHIRATLTLSEAAYLMNLGAQAQRDKCSAVVDVFQTHMEFDDIDSLQVLRDASKENE